MGAIFFRETRIFLFSVGFYTTAPWTFGVLIHYKVRQQPKDIVEKGFKCYIIFPSSNSDFVQPHAQSVDESAIIRSRMHAGQSCGYV